MVVSRCRRLRKIVCVVQSCALCRVVRCAELCVVQSCALCRVVRCAELCVVQRCALCRVCVVQGLGGRVAGGRAQRCPSPQQRERKP